MCATPFPTRHPVASGSPASASSAHVSVDLSDSEIGCGGPDTYLASMIAEARRHPESVATEKTRVARATALPKFDPWEHPHD
jgi:hypothetical protein